MGSRMGYEYRYGFRVEDELLSRYCSFIDDLKVKLMFEIRTNFIVKRKSSDEMIICSESYPRAASSEERRELYLEQFLGKRLEDYWMSNDEIKELVCKLLAFAKLQRAKADPRLGTIPIVVDLDVCTVQQDGEPIKATMDRAIRSEYLYPLHLCPMNDAAFRKEYYDRVNIFLMFFLRYDLRTIRVEDVDNAMSDMEACPICLRNPTIGAQISWLCCGHAFHNHCVVGWLQNNNSCPICRREGHDREFRSSCKRDELII